MLSPISLQSNCIPTTALAPRVRASRHIRSRAWLRLSVSSLVYPATSFRQRPELRAQAAEVIAGPHDQPEHVAVDLSNPVAGYREFQRELATSLVEWMPFIRQDRCGIADRAAQAFIMR